MKRYDRYKDSGIEWIGEIPEHWEVKRLKYVVEMNSGNGITSEMIKEEGDFPVFGGNGIRGYYSHYTHEGSFILIGRQGALCGNINYSNGKFWASEHAIVCTPKIEYNVKWFGELLRTMNLNQYSVSAAQPGLSVENLKVLQIPIPPLPEQHAIAAYLDRKTAEIDALIADKKRLLELYEEEKTALINQAVTKGITPGVPMKDSGVEWLGEVPEHWEVKRFDFLFSFSRGLSITKADLQDTGIPCVSYGEVHSKYGFEVNPEVHPLKCVSEQYLDTAKKSLLEYGDFVFADTSEDIEGSGNFTYLNSNAPTFAGYHTIIAKPKITFESRYVAYFFNSLEFRNQIRSKVTGTKVYSITQLILKLTNIVLPPIEEQKEIVAFIDKEIASIDAKKAKTEKLIELLVEYRAALISEVVTGGGRIVGL